MMIPPSDDEQEGGPGSETEPDLTAQVFRLLDGRLNDDEAAELYWRMENDPAARATYRRCVNLHVAMRTLLAPASEGEPDGAAPDDRSDHAGRWRLAPARGFLTTLAPATAEPGVEGRPEPFTEGSTVAATRRSIVARLRRRPTVIAAAAAAILLVAWLGGQWMFRRPTPVATLAMAIDARWDGAAVAPGAAVPVGPLGLREGLVKLTFAGGAQVVITAPARFTPESAGQLLLEHGRLTAVVPPAAVGFTVRTPSARLVDLGTEFSVEVSDAQGTRTNVAAGAVALSGGNGNDAASARIAAGTAARVLPRSTRVESVAVTAIPVPRVAEVDAWSTGGSPESYRRWIARGSAAGLETRAGDLVVRFDFDAAAGDSSLAGTTATAPVVGRVNGQGVGGVPGPFADAGSALRLDGTGSYVHLGRHPALDQRPGLTLAAWVRPQATDGLRQIIGSGFDPESGWEAFLRLNDGQYQAGIGVGNQWRDHKVERPIPPGDVGNWVHIAAVYDGRGWRLYRNGETDMPRTGDPNMLALRLTGARDWYAGARVRHVGGDEGTRSADRFFKGDIDDVRVYGVALNAAEVARLARRAP